jgi:hypothetical protein
MIKQVSIQSLIEQHTNYRSIQTGWIVGKCPCCHDYKERSGFKFEDGAVIYNCWNCSKAGRYEEFSGKMSRNFRGILLAQGIDEDEISSAVNSAFFFKKPDEPTEISLNNLKKIDTSTSEIEFPKNTFQLGHANYFSIQEKIVDYLASRNISFEKYDFRFSLEEKLLNRVIIPFYRNGKLIYWQARSVLKDEKKRYENAYARREAVMFNMDQLQSFDKKPLFVSEGIFDAMLVDGIGLLGSSLNEAKLELLKRTRRRLIFIIDKDKNGGHIAETAMANGWEIVFTPDGTEDLSDSVDRFGLSWTMFSIMNSMPSDANRAKLLIKRYCR